MDNVEQLGKEAIDSPIKANNILTLIQLAKVSLLLYRMSIHIDLNALLARCVRGFTLRNHTDLSWCVRTCAIGVRQSA